MKQKRALAIHDISCLGRCSLTVALPIISAAGAEAAVMPTAVLSTHTGGFEGYTFRDLTDDLLPIAAHWEALGEGFDAIYTGYLGSFEQIGIISQIMDQLKGKDTFILVDPVMADNGELYSGFPSDFPLGMATLCKKADIIVPNITEAAMLTGMDYRVGPYTQDYILELLQKLGALCGGGQVVLTGVYFDEHELGCACYDAKSGRTEYVLGARIPTSLHGTGDVFGSALCGALLRGKTLAESARIAVDYTRITIERTVEQDIPLRNGPCFELALPDYIEMLR